MRFLVIALVLASTAGAQEGARQLQPDAREQVRAQRTCLARYRTKDAGAAAAARMANPRFLSAISSGVVIYEYLPGIDCCDTMRARSLNAGNSQPLRDANVGPPFVSQWQAGCSAVASEYAARFNRDLAKRRPDLFRKACPYGKLIEPGAGP